METSTALYKTKRYRIYEKTKLNNLVNHIFRNYKPETIQYKRDFNADNTKNNLLIDSDFNISEFDQLWFDKVQNESLKFKNLLQESLDKADQEAGQKVSLSRQQKDLTLKSITYFSNLKNYDEHEETEILKIISQCQNVKGQDKNNKDYSVIDKKTLKSALDFYNAPPEHTKIKSLNAKKKNLTQLIETVDKMQVHNERRATASSRSIGFEEILFKIPKHNNKSIKDTDMLSIVKEFHDQYYPNFDLLGGAFHKDERTKKNNAVDDHLHIIRSGFNKETKRFDLPDFTHKLGLKLAENQGIKFEHDKKKYNETTENLRTLSANALQTEFYRFTNERLQKLGYNFIIEKKELTEEEKELRAFLKEQSNLPKSLRSQNLNTYFEEQARKNIKTLNKAKDLTENKKTEYKNVVRLKNKYINEAKKAKEEMEKSKSMLKDLEEKIRKAKDFLQEKVKSWFDNLVKGIVNNEQKNIIKSANSNNELEEINKEFSKILDQEVNDLDFDQNLKKTYQETRKNKGFKLK